MTTDTRSTPGDAGSEVPWQQAVRAFTQPDARKATWQLINTFVPYLALWAAMIATRLLGLSYWLTLALAVPAAFLSVRIFIFFHDACHGSFYPSSRANTIVGYVCGTLTFTSFEEWKASHAYHHATVLGRSLRGKKETVNVVGRLCENNDQFAKGRDLPVVRVGDYIVIHNAGAHSYAMGHNYNNRLRSAEYLITEGGDIEQIRRAETIGDLFRTTEGFGL